MEKIDEHTSSDLLNLQPIGQSEMGSTIPLAPADCAADAPC
jgi:hypothetical protein